MNSNFNLLNKCYKFIEYYDNILINFPNKTIVLKKSIETSNYQMIENLFAYNINKTDRIKEKYIKDFLIKLSMIDFYTTNAEYINKYLMNYKNIPIYEKGKGLPIGNMTSQILAIFYLNDLDHYIKEKIKIKYYIRYMDDFILIHPYKKYLKYCQNLFDELNDKDIRVKLDDRDEKLSYKK